MGWEISYYFFWLLILRCLSWSCLPEPRQKKNRWKYILNTSSLHDVLLSVPCRCYEKYVFKWPETVLELSNFMLINLLCLFDKAVSHVLLYFYACVVLLGFLYTRMSAACAMVLCSGLMLFGVYKVNSTWYAHYVTSVVLWNTCCTLPTTTV